MSSKTNGLPHPEARSRSDLTSDGRGASRGRAIHASHGDANHPNLANRRESRTWDGRSASGNERDPDTNVLHSKRDRCRSGSNCGAVIHSSDNAGKADIPVAARSERPATHRHARRSQASELKRLPRPA